MAHAEELFPILSEAKLYDFIDGGPPESIEDLRQRLSRSESRKSPDGTEHWLNWVVRNAAGQAVGCVQATIAADLETNVAYTIGSTHWGRGIARRAVNQMLNIVSAQFAVKKFFVVAERQNVRSVRLAESLGFSAATAEQCHKRAISTTEVCMQKVLP